MKLTNTLTMKRKTGMTLLELTVVILVLLSLISILFIGARAWKKGSDRAANILNIRNVQQAVRAHANVRGLAIGDACPSSDIIGTGKYLNSVSSPVPGTITYTPGSTVPAMGTLYLGAAYATSDDESTYGPTPGSYTEW
jgi:type II secretory pathway pseudopilin PulG